MGIGDKRLLTSPNNQKDNLLEGVQYPTVHIQKIFQLYLHNSVIQT